MGIIQEQGFLAPRDQTCGTGSLLLTAGTKYSIVCVVQEEAYYSCNTVFWTLCNQTAREKLEKAY